MKTKVQLIVLLFSVIVFYNTPCFSQIEHRHNYWLSTGIGASYFEDMGISSKIDGCIQLKKIILQARYTINYEVSQEFLLGDELRPLRYTNDIGILCGVMIYDGRVVELSTSGGCSFLFGRNRGKFIDSESVGIITNRKNYESDNFVTVGLPLDFQFKYTGEKNMGIGFTLISNINQKFSYIGGLVTYSIGNLRRL